MSHGYAVINGDGVEFSGEAAFPLDESFHLLPDLVKVYMTGYELCEGVRNGDDRFPEVLFFHAIGAPEAPGAGHFSALSAE